MAFSWFDRLKKGWNAFLNKENNPNAWSAETRHGTSAVYLDTPRPLLGADRTILNAILNRIAIDVASIQIRHCRVDQDGRFISDIVDGLYNALTTEANIDQTGRAMIQNAVLMMLVEGHCAIAPIDLEMNPLNTEVLEVRTLRVGRVIEWFPEAVRLEIYNDRKGVYDSLLLPKRMVAIVQNPMYFVMNGPNGTLKRLVNMMQALDAISEKLGSRKLDAVVQLPYKVRSAALEEDAKRLTKSIENQLKDSSLGIAYIDSTTHLTQLNRSLENNLQSSIDALTKQLYGQLGISEEVINGVADEQQMLLYNNRTIEPIISAICEEMTRKFLTRTARSKGERVKFFKDPFRLVAVNQIADIADKFTRNEILSPNEMRTIIGMQPSADESADELRNRNISQPMVPGQMPPTPIDTINSTPIDPTTPAPM